MDLSNYGKFRIRRVYIFCNTVSVRTGELTVPSDKNRRIPHLKTCNRFVSYIKDSGSFKSLQTMIYVLVNWLYQMANTMLCTLTILCRLLNL